MTRQSYFLKHSEEPVSCDPLQDILRPPSGHSDMAASSPFPQITAGVWPRSLLSFCFKVWKWELVGAVRRTGCPMGVETQPCSSLLLLSTVSELQGTYCENSGLH